MIDILTFTGVDVHTSFGRLSKISARYPRVEFGVLVGTHSGEEDRGIFPPLEFVELFRDYARWSNLNVRSAIHLCGAYSRALIQGGDQTDLLELCAGFDRVQVNLHGDLWNADEIDVRGGEHAIMSFASEVIADKVILQHRAKWDMVPIKSSDIEYLFDLSEGRGLDSFSSWPAPNGKLKRYGYAGGIGLGNIGQVVKFASEYPNTTMWFDMESKVRTRGLFNLDIVEEICAEVWPNRSGR